MRRVPLLACAFLLTTLAAGGALAQSSDRAGSPGAPGAQDDRFLRFDDAADPSSQRAIVPEPATLGMIALGGSAMFYPRRRARLYR